MDGVHGFVIPAKAGIQRSANREAQIISAASISSASGETIDSTHAYLSPIFPSGMSYQEQDLWMFVPLTNPDDRVGTNYFEFHPKEVVELHECWLQGSLLIRDAAFDFFSECFHSASESFDYFSSQRFGEEEIARLLTEIDSFLSDIATTPSREIVFSRYASLFTLDIWSEVDTQVLAEKVKDCGASLRSFIYTNTKVSKCLWVMGM